MYCKHLRRVIVRRHLKYYITLDDSELFKSNDCTIYSTIYHYSYSTYILDQLSTPVTLSSPALSSDKKKEDFINFTM